MPNTMQVNPMISRIIASVSVCTIGPIWCPLVSARCELDDTERPRMWLASQASYSEPTAMAESRTSGRDPGELFIARSHCIPIEEVFATH